MAATQQAPRSPNPADLPVAVLYSFGGSCWASAPRLALIEKGYSSEECIIKDVDLLNGANFDPAYLKINNHGTVPTLVVPQLESAVSPDRATRYTSITDSIPLLEFLDAQRSSTTVKESETPARSLAPASLQAKQRDDAIIALVHEDAADPNFALLSARTKEELAAKNSGVPGQFVRGRKKAIEGYLKDIQGEHNARLENFYKGKLEAMNQLLAVYDGSAPPSDFFAKSTQAWAGLVSTLRKLDNLLPREDRSGFITLADLHTGAWFGRILAVAGAEKLDDIDGAFDKLIKTFDGQALKAEDVKNLKNWWTAMAKRDSFKQVYADGLH